MPVITISAKMNEQPSRPMHITIDLTLRANYWKLALLLATFAICLSARAATGPAYLYYGPDFPEHFTHQINYTGKDVTFLPDGTIFKYSTCESYFESCTSDRETTGQFAEVSIWNPAAKQWMSEKVSDFLSGSATVLTNDGRIVWVGGETSLDTNITIGKTAVYDSKTQTFSSGPTLHEARSQHSATELANGDILIAGGWTADNHTTATVELLSGLSLKTLPPMLQSRSWHSAIRLRSGNVLVIGGRQVERPGSENQVLNTVELYDVTKNSWREMPSMPVARLFHSATLLSDGRVMILGGEASDMPVGQSGRPGYPLSASVFFWNPATEQWSSAPDMPTARELHAAILLSNGDVLVSGGLDEKYTPILDLLLWNHNTGKWTAAGHLATKLDYRSMELLANGDVFLGSDLLNDEMVIWSRRPESALANARSEATSTGVEDERGIEQKNHGMNMPENLTREGAPFHFVVAPLRVPINLKTRSDAPILHRDPAQLGALLIAGIVVACIVRKRLRQRR